MAILFLFLDIAAASDYCNFASDRESCEKIMQYPFPDFIKQMLLDYLFYDKEIPDHDAVYSWNRNLNLNFDKKNKGVIRDAYVKLISISPSVLINDKLYITDKGKVLVKQGHRVEFPSGKERGDCKTRYILRSEDAELKLYINNKQTNNEFSSLYLNHNQPAEVKAVYNIEVKYRVKHYEKERYCCKKKKICYNEICIRRCVRHCNKCVYDSSEYRKEKLELHDSIDAFYFNDKPVYNLEILNKYYDTINGKIDGSFSSLELNFKNAYFKQFNYFYSLVFDNQNIITIIVNEKEHFDYRNLVVDQVNETFEFFVKNSECEIIVRDHFSEYKESCNLDFEKPETDDVEEDNVKINYGPLVKITIIVFLIYLTFKISKKFSRSGLNG